jgi:hypothetical protein
MGPVGFVVQRTRVVLGVEIYARERAWASVGVVTGIVTPRLTDLPSVVGDIPLRQLPNPCPPESPSVCGSLGEFWASDWRAAQERPDADRHNSPLACGNLKRRSNAS